MAVPNIFKESQIKVSDIERPDGEVNILIGTCNNRILPKPVSMVGILSYSCADYFNCYTVCEGVF